ncbi:MAG: methyl-accepting chemotaxis protein [Ruminococcus sp.]|jgi:methyl-accepting chemotaxis protein|nr:methyl-accepting chemotaxis protein [Ruminococcus sp.]
MKKFGITQKIVILSASAVIISSIVLIIISTMTYYSNQIHTAGKTAVAVSETLSSFLDGDMVEADIKQGFRSDVEEWQKMKDAADLALKKLESTGGIYLYVMTPADQYDLTYYYLSAVDRDGEIDYYAPEAANVFDAEMFDVVMAEGVTFYGGVYESGDYGKLISGYAPVFNSKGEAVAAVGTDYSVDSVLKDTFFFSLIIILSAVVLIAGEMFLLLKLFSKLVKEPIQTVTECADAVSMGWIDIAIPENHSHDEIATLNQAFAKLREGSATQTHQLSEIAGGDLSIDLTLRSDTDALGLAVHRLVAHLREIISSIHSDAKEVNAAAGSLGSSSENLTMNAESELSTVNELKDTTDKILKHIHLAAKTAENSAEAELGMTRITSDGSRKMHELSVSVNEIKDAGNAIETVIRVIDDIAFQTNILALNASVEAARAGEHGKGFSVVAEEVRSLAARSAKAAKDTSELIEQTVEKAEDGARMCAQTAIYFDKISDAVKESSEKLTDLSADILNLEKRINTIRQDVDTITNLAEHNGMLANELATTSQQCMALSNELEREAGSFKL